MKKSFKLKSSQANKGNLKISSFFTKEVKDSQNTQSPQTIQISHESKNEGVTDTKCIVNVDSDDDFVDRPNRTLKKCVLNKENVSIVLKPSPQDDKVNKPSKKRKVCESSKEDPAPKKSNIQDMPLSPNAHPSTSENIFDGPITPSKQNNQVIFVKKPESLLSTEALKEYHTPEKQRERFLDKIQTPSPRKLLFNDFSDTKQSSEGLLSKIDELTIQLKKITTPKKTPKKTTPKKEHNSQSKKEKVTDVTPKKAKKTPKKLFEKSPVNVDSFNIQVIKDFVKITPSKSSVKSSTNETDDVIIVKSSEKTQSSILKYVSPVASTSSLKAKQNNESTPQKEVQNEFKTPTERVKTRLNFENCEKIKQSDISKSPSCKSIESSRELEKSVDTEENEVNFSFNFDDGWEEDLLQDPAEFNLDLTESQHCKIIGINPFAKKSVLTLKSTKTGEKAICNLEGFWIHTMLAIGDTVHVSARKVEEEWVVDNDHGLLVYEPDLLVSTTSVVGSLWCKRRCVLTERFRGFEPSNQHMLLGSLIHTLLQFILRNKIYDREGIEKVVKNITKGRSTIKSLYECGITLEYIQMEVMKFVPKIQHFVDLYVKNSDTISKRVHNKDDWTGKISDIEDIEENIWCPELGVKGKVDVSVKNGMYSLPLELKTGRATVSLEHRGQVMLYIMMMKKLGYNVPSGLLLYLREGVLREIKASWKEKRDILLLRNELTYYLTRKPKTVELDGGQKLFPPEIPEPINHSSCRSCPYNIICTSYAKYMEEDISSNKILKDIQENALAHLKESHLNYFMKWITLISYEANAKNSAKDVREIYTQTPQQREMNGRCIINLKVTSVMEECDGICEHTFEKMDTESEDNFLANGIMESNYIVISTDERPAVAAGFVTDITASSISVTLDRDLNKKYSGKPFHIDSYESTSLQSYNLASLTLLLEMTLRGEELRDIIIDKTPPTFKTTLPKLIGTAGKQILKRLNKVQQRAVLKAIAANEYFLIKGMPGTGKTATIVALIQLLYELNKTILITSHTHSAVDNVCLKLLTYGVKLMRLGAESKIHPKLKQYSEHNLTKHCTSPEQFEEVYNSAKILAVTCFGSGHPVLTKRTMDICIVDESTQVLQSSVIRPLYAAKTFILIGDPDQLPAVVKDTNARKLGMSESLFERLYKEEAMVALNLNYRMNSVITDLANKFTYEGNLLVGNEEVAKATLKLPNEEVLGSVIEGHDWILKALDSSLQNAIQFIDTGPVWNLQQSVSWMTQKMYVGTEENSQSESDSSVNIYEAAVTVNLIKALLKAGVAACQIGVIATYRNQVAQISALVQSEHIDVSTVDRFQGKDKSVIIYSCTKSRDVSTPRTVNKFEILEDKRRLTVAITRAKHKLIVVGDIQTLVEYSTFQKLVPLFGKNVIRLAEVEGFKWTSILNLHL
nr:DNA replication ATP-dependent helicase/nuclease DNA2-like [Leptinotarsa decemlineata]